MDNPKRQSTGPINRDRNHDNDVKNLHCKHNELSKSRIQKAKECIECLRFSEGLVRRDIDLIRMQLEIKLKKLESRLQAELRNVVESETAKLEKFIAEVNSLEDSESTDDKIKAINELSREADSIERKRLKFVTNKALERSLDDITSFGNIILEKVSDCDSMTNIKEKRNVVKQLELPNGLRRLSLDLRPPSQTQQISIGENSFQIQKRPQRVSSLSSDRDHDNGDLILTKTQNKIKKGDVSEERTVGHSSICTRNEHLQCNTEELMRNPNEQRSQKTPEEKRNNKRVNVYQERTSELNRNATQNRNSHSNQSNEGTMDAKSEDWLKADPLSVLRALKLQTSRTEENLKAIRELKHDTEDKPKDKALVNGLVVESGKPTVARNTANDKRKGLSNYTRSGLYDNTERKNSSENYSRKNRDSINRNDHMYMKHIDETQVDKVARANELWFGRDRKRQNDTYKRRTRSLSPKTVRFYDENTDNDLLAKHNEVFLDDGNETLTSSSVVNTLSKDVDNPSDNDEKICKKSKSLHSSMVSEPRPYNRDIQNENITSKNRKDVHGSEMDDSKAGMFTSLMSRNGINIETFDKNTLELSQSSFEQNPLFVSRKPDETNGELYGSTMYKHIPYTEGITRATHFSTYKTYSPDLSSSSSPTNEENTKSYHDKRQQRLRDRRRRNRTINGITTESVPLPFPHYNNSTAVIDSHCSTEMDQKNDLCRNEDTSAIETPSNNKNLLDISCTPSKYYIPRRRLHSEGSRDTKHKEDTSDNEEGDGREPEIDMANDLIASDKEHEQGAPLYFGKDTKSYKIKTERQRIPSFKEMLFLD